MSLLSPKNEIDNEINECIEISEYMAFWEKLIGRNLRYYFGA